ncbi:hypothetical protein QRX50_26860 [Amycolatopsis carbonis]|uniref:Uncharacterized protein n=1 Tax=Amycolatopsis carbonis TaxID=715471 RepID=A0A9Y2MU05_9PSEU|nr:hypothetical protein [Amycolatopsis sp. 2-15]WIX75162.1 hypothetical protein QRX50_26860 [Amycolatopsis sp. 2-15]
MSAVMAPVIMGNPDRPKLGEELKSSFCRTDKAIAQVLRRPRSCQTTAWTYLIFLVAATVARAIGGLVRRTTGDTPTGKIVRTVVRP